jgi:DNA polymerase elongation subunit (family B)
MSFISAYHDRQRDKVLVWERTQAGVRVRKEYDSPRYFYVPDRLGAYESITGIRLKKLTCSSFSDFEQASMAEPDRFESDFDPDERVLMDEYSTRESTMLKVGLIDIEVDYRPDVGFAGPKDPYAPINAITLYFKDTDEYVTLAVPPKGWDWATQMPDDLKHVTLFKTEREMLEVFLDLLHDIDIVSGWNSEFFDIPYIGRRLQLVFGEQGLARLGFEGSPMPRWSEKVRFKFGSEKDPVLNLISRAHLDYLRLFRKFNLTTRQSFGLEAVGVEELGIPKLHYEGSLHDLYNDNFLEFLRYNTHDVRIIKLLDDKYSYIDLANRMVHEATVNFESVFGSVTLIDTAITNYAHNVLKKIVIDRAVRPQGDPVEGAIVVTPNTGFYEWIGACDINSLYPSTIRSLNLSPEKIVGQLMGRTGVEPKTYLVPERKLHKTDPIRTEQDRKPIQRWGHEAKHTRYIETDRDKLNNPGSGGAPKDIFDFKCVVLTELTTYVYSQEEYAWLAYKDAKEHPENAAAQDVLLDIKLENEEVVNMRVGDLVTLCAESGFAVSAFGTITDQANGEGLVAAVLSYWFNGRKEMQAEKKKASAAKSALLKAGKAKDAPEVLEQARLEAYNDVLQGVRKVLLNSTYGAMLNEYSRFGDPRIGASVTFTGRQVAQHMINMVSKTLIGENSPELVKIFDPSMMKDAGGGTGPDARQHDRRWGANYYEINNPTKNLGAIYGDTDSVYFTMAGLVTGEDQAIELANAVAEEVNISFPTFMRSAFNCQASFDTLIRANRELVCRSGIIQAKKKYMMAIVDKEGKTIAVGDDDELKTMGSDIKLSSTPEVIKKLLKSVVMLILNKAPRKEIDEEIIKFRSSLQISGDEVINPLDIATVQSVRELEEAMAKWRLLDGKGMGKAKLAANARAAVNYNYLIEKHKLTGEPLIIGGAKIKILWLKDNDEGFTNIAFPSDFEDLPKWFTDRFEVDMVLMEQKLVDQKLANIFDPLGWEVPTFQSQKTNLLLQF